jgi:hypothetical protein
MTHSLKSAQWYWGTLSPDEINDLFVNAKDGTFLVRDSANDQGNFVNFANF